MHAFSRGFRTRKPQWHRAAGRPLIVLGLVAAVTGLWLTLSYPHVPTDGPTLYFVRLVVGTTMTIFIAFAIGAIGKRNFARHGEWMIRGDSGRVALVAEWIIRRGRGGWRRNGV